MILDSCDVMSLKSLRCSSKRLAYLCAPRLFEKLHIGALQASFDKLKGITNHPFIMPLVKRLVIDWNLFLSAAARKE